MSYPESTFAKESICLGEVEHPVHFRSRAELHKRSSIGRFGFLNSGTVVYGNTQIGRFFCAGRQVEIGVAQHPTHALSTHGFVLGSGWFPRTPDYGVENLVRHVAHPKTIIGHDVWIGSHAIVISGLTIGTGAVVAANSTVTKDVPPYAIVAGSPARIIRMRFDEEIIAGLLETAWWERDFDTIRKLPFDNVERCIEELRRITGRSAALDG
ncbi:CatB-related O-acetyltransferase [Rhizobium rhizogenes]|uniref:CatB-related O-acetyltransferase n=1 Tax=Rhizobium rhizogenes TaxID=359 RepID=UPI001572A06D|nr:CatB-related O-acetyltransferase [Rhizobium rhizogenes]NTF90934.1 CatB-related O-acetyltransferase [Rhizobium rhizogenes]